MSARDLALINPILPGFWVRPSDDIESDLARLRASEPRAWREEPETDSPLLPRGPGYWAVMRHADVLHCSKHPELFSSASGITLMDSPPEFNEFFGSMIAMDDPRHARLRKLVSAGFTPKMLKRVEDSVQRIAAEILDEVAGKGDIDFVTEVAAALPLRTICDMMAIPASQYDFVFEQTNIVLGASDPEYVADQTVERVLGALLQAGADLCKVMEDVSKHRQGHAGELEGDDLTTALLNAEVDGERLTQAELNSFFVLLVVAGNETTRNAISWGLKYLTDNPDQRAIWQADFEGLARGAVDEIVRLASPVSYMRRTATADTKLGHTEIRAGQKLCLFYLSANRDEDVFPDPLRFDVRRDNSHHVGFGGPGPHFCLGAHLARREITVMFRELFKRLPDIVAAGEPAPLMSSFIHGVKHLRATFAPR